MGKRKGPKRIEASTSTKGSLPFNNPFATLSGLRDELPAVAAGQPSPEPQPRAAPVPAGLAGCAKLVVQRERKGRAGKTVTRICGLPAQLIDEVTPRIKSALGCGATVEDQDVVVLGDLVERVAEWLRGEGAGPVVVSGSAQPGGARQPPSPPSSWREGSRRADLQSGLTVDIVLKGDQGTGKLTRGVVQDILTRSATHPHGIKVRLTDGNVGRVKRVVGE